MTNNSPSTPHGRLIASTCGVASCSFVGAIVGAVSGMTPFLNLASGYEGLFRAQQTSGSEQNPVEQNPVPDSKGVVKIEPVSVPEQVPADNADEEIGMTCKYFCAQAM